MKLKLRQVGNSIGVLLPREAIEGYKVGDEIEMEVITKSGKIEGLKKLIEEPKIESLTEWE